MKTRKIKINGTPMLFNDIKNCEGYWVSRCGKVYSEKSDKILATRVSHNGYERVTIGRKKYYVHRLVVQAWIGDVGVGNGTDLHVDHIDFNKLNNHADNLRIISRRDNVNRHKNPLTGAHLSSDGKWIAQIRVNGWLQYLGTYETQEQAHARYKIARMLLSAQ